MIVVFAGFAWFAGLALADKAGWGWWPWLGAAGILTLFAFLARNRPRLRQGAILLAAFCLGGFRLALARPAIDESQVAFFNGSQDVTLTGLVDDEPELGDRSLRLTLRVETLTLAGGPTVKMGGRVLVTTDPFPAIPYGARLRLTGNLEAPQSSSSFDYETYLARRGVYSVMAWPRITLLETGAGKPFYQAIYAFKGRAQAIITRLIPDPAASLLSGILLGNDSGLPADLSADFRATGMTHIIAISGFNITILAGVLVGLAEPLLGKRRAPWFALTGIALYTILVGADAAVVRAAIMGGIYLVGSKMLGRPNYSFASLFAAGFLMTAFNPYSLWDVGFQLSFMATLGLMLYAGPFDQWTRQRLLRLLPARSVKAIMGLLSEAVLVTLAAQVTTIPLMLFYFGQLSLVSLVANPLILPAQPAVMLWGGLATLLGLVSPLLAQPVAWVAWLFLAYTITVVRLLARLPWAAVPLSLGPGGLAGLYLLIAGITWLAWGPPARRLGLRATLRRHFTTSASLGGLGLLALLSLGWALSQPDGLLHVTFFDVGQGEAIFIETPSGRKILVDGGSSPSLLADRLGRAMPFWDRSLDLLVATHADADHVAGLPAAFSRYRVARLLTNGLEAGGQEAYTALLQAAAGQELAPETAQAGGVVAVDDGVRLEVLNPNPDLGLPGDNNSSIVLRLVYGNLALLLTGDAEAPAEEAMLQRGLPLQAQVVKAGHHGANTSTSAALLVAARPQVVVISVGAGNRYGHPHPETLARIAGIGASVLRTDELGSIELISDGQRMWWQAWR